jgi:ribosomal-protein-alanine N-acetyltransferase
MHHNINETKILYDKWIAEYDNLKTYRWIIETKATQELIGTIDASSPFEKYGTISIGYICGKKHWDHGYITEAAQAV